MEIVEHHLFRVTRNADLAIEEDEADDLLLAIEEELRRRRFGEAVRLEVERSMPDGDAGDPAARARPRRGRRLRGPRACSTSPGLRDLVDLDRPDLKSEPWTPVTPPRLVPPDEDEPADVFAAIRVGDLLVHHPYESFAASIERFIAQAVDDPDVLTIKMTLYRTSGDSPIVRDLIRAAERGKQVVVLVEIKARFDEEANIVWARKLEQAGAHVVYGLVGLKTHSKVCLVVRREGSGPAPLRPHRDRQLQPEDGPPVHGPRPADVPAGARRRRDRPVQRPDRPVPPARRSGGCSSRRTASARGSSSSSTARSSTPRVGHEARIVLKLNAIVDEPSIDALYRASQAGVAVDVIARGALLAAAGRRRACPSTSGSARSSASSSSTPGSGASPTAATPTGTSARPT